MWFFLGSPRRCLFVLFFCGRQTLCADAGNSAHADWLKSSHSPQLGQGGRGEEEASSVQKHIPKIQIAQPKVPAIGAYKPVAVDKTL
jgi:hypothetical protein